jgi:hypothetical protein
MLSRERGRRGIRPSSEAQPVLKKGDRAVGRPSWQPPHLRFLRVSPAFWI